MIIPRGRESGRPGAWRKASAGSRGSPAGCAPFVAGLNAPTAARPNRHERDRGPRCAKQMRSQTISHGRRRRVTARRACPVGAQGVLARRLRCLRASGGWRDKVAEDSHLLYQHRKPAMCAAAARRRSREEGRDLRLHYDLSSEHGGLEPR